MAEQIIISISREFGTGGREIAGMIAKDLGIALYDRNILEEIAEEKNTEIEHLERVDEKPRNLLLSRKVKGYSNSMEENLAQMQFEYLRKKADSGESFVVVGRCSETVLKDREALVSIFVTGEIQDKIERIMKKDSLSEEEAKAKLNRHDKTRRKYHNHHSEHKWGDSRYYDICINSSRLGVEGTAKLLEEYIKRSI
ncbi:MAG: cytidylate kinase-like family protein [Lachnospiraceae bacterium]|nr:cytidylate kinase-like family protein [Lachnospiraceae bacterium]